MTLDGKYAPPPPVGLRLTTELVWTCLLYISPGYELYHEQNRKKKTEEKEQEGRWEEWMRGLDERIRRRREGQEGREEEG